MPRKFDTGDKVIIKRVNDRTPKELLDTLRLDHPRTITAVFYDKGTQHTRYYLGSNRRGEQALSNTFFRSSQLRKWSRGNIGRPRTIVRRKRHLSNSQGVLCVKGD